MQSRKIWINIKRYSVQTPEMHFARKTCPRQLSANGKETLDQRGIGGGETFSHAASHLYKVRFCGLRGPREMGASNHDSIGWLCGTPAKAVRDCTSSVSRHSALWSESQWRHMFWVRNLGSSRGGSKMRCCKGVNWQLVTVNTPGWEAFYGICVEMKMYIVVWVFGGLGWMIFLLSR